MVPLTLGKPPDTTVTITLFKWRWLQRINMDQYARLCYVHVVPGNSNVDSLEKLSVTPFLNWCAFFHSDQANPGGGPDKEEEGGEDDDAERGEGDQAQGPLPVKG